MRRWLRTLHERLVMLLLLAQLIAQAVVVLLLLEQESFVDEITEVACPTALGRALRNLVGIRCIVGVRNPLQWPDWF